MLDRLDAEAQEIKSHIALLQLNYEHNKNLFLKTATEAAKRLGMDMKRDMTYADGELKYNEPEQGSTDKEIPDERDECQECNAEG